jgi:Protein of unknown function (DUF1553)/Protein of unknown function (DUF1549)/Planctomycete cytochrome C
MTRWFVLVSACLITTGSGRAADGPARPSSGDSDFFERKVRPLLIRKCHSCHSTAARKQRGGLLLDNRPAILKGGDSGPAVVPGRPDQSRLLRAVRYTDADLQMPPRGKLLDTDIAILAEWIRRGVPYPGPTTTVAKSAINIEEGRKFWAFRPLAASPPPPVRDSSWPRRRIDGFLLAALENKGLAPSPETDRRTLIRRLSFDLTGLPPTPAEVGAFVGDTRPDADERLVDRLLASPHHGERWGRFWLDLARYCDVAEPWAPCKGKPYHYRDWVVQALNDDMPYDRFVSLQLAADQLPGARLVDRAALSFLGLSPSYWKELKLAPDVIKVVVAEEWEERIHTVSSTFLGLTVACARCHDHKFDPITQRDYYALAGIFASIREADLPLLPGIQVEAIRKARERIAAVQKEMMRIQAKKPVGADARKKLRELQSQIEQIRKETPQLDAPLVPGVVDASLSVLPDGLHRTRLEYRAGMAQNVAMQVRGNPASPGPVVPRRFLQVLSSGTPQPFPHGSGRLDLARAIVGEGAPLAARVMVNRIWKHHFGKGLVETPSNFGHEGERPSHPELLDDLAARFIASGWSLKWLHREIVLSAAYRQSSRSTTEGGSRVKSPSEVDPDNRLLWRMNRRRLEVESWRDAMLAVGGSFDERIGGESQDLGSPDNRRRTLYGTIKRREINDLLRLYDFPDPTTHSAFRTPTTTPLQQLFVLNSPFLKQQAEALAHRLQAQPGTPEDRVRYAYRLLYARPASPTEVKLGTAFLTQDRAAGPVPGAVWEQYAQVLLGSNEFLFVD